MAPLKQPRRRTVSLHLSSRRMALPMSITHPWKEVSMPHGLPMTTIHLCLPKGMLMKLLLRRTQVIYQPKWVSMEHLLRKISLSLLWMSRMIHLTTVKAKTMLHQLRRTLGPLIISTLPRLKAKSMEIPLRRIHSLFSSHLRTEPLRFSIPLHRKTQPFHLRLITLRVASSLLRSLASHVMWGLALVSLRDLFRCLTTTLLRQLFLKVLQMKLRVCCIS
mmetsp:Transcript_22976/g.46018  ORF Transcript_22976/g.46018 Transcript_22976/m.46018 type:complete len:219 (+) Transcript_22976:445-1101(+)